MNWCQIYSAAIPQERQEILFSMLHRLRPERSGAQSKGRRLFPPAHYIHDRRRQRKPSAYPLFVIAILALSVGVITYSDPRLGLTFAAWLGGALSLSIAIRSSRTLLHT